MIPQRSCPTRRDLLRRCANGFGAVALSALLEEYANAKVGDSLRESPSTRGASGLHHEPKATSVIFLYMDGGPSQIDTFDPKPRLDREHGQPIKMKTPPTQFNDVGKVLKCPWPFKQYGQSGIPV